MSYRIYGRAGQKVVTGVVSDQVGGDQGFIPDDQNSGDTSMSSHPQTRLVNESDASGDEMSDAFVVTSKNQSIRNLEDVGNESVTSLQYTNNQDKMNTGVEVRKPTENIIY